MRIANRTRSTLLGLRVELAATWWSRLRGFLGRPEPAPGEGILLAPCNAIHTVGLGYDLDVLFLDEGGKVLDLVKSLRPWRLTRRVPGARYVLELSSGTIELSGTQVGDSLTWREGPPSPVGGRPSHSEAGYRSPLSRHARGLVDEDSRGTAGGRSFGIGGR